MGSCCKVKFAMRFYKWVCFLLVLIFVAIGVLGVYYMEDLLKILVGTIHFLIINFNKNTSRDVINIMQRTGKCCGSMSPQDYSKNNTHFDEWIDHRLERRLDNWDNATQGAYFNLTRGVWPVPDSCCRLDKKEPYCVITNNFEGRAVGTNIQKYDDPQAISNGFFLQGVGVKISFSQK